MGDDTRPLRLLGVVNFRPLDGTPGSAEAHGLNIAEAYLRAPFSWSPDYVDPAQEMGRVDGIPLADERYLLSCRTAILPKGRWPYSDDDVALFAHIRTVPFSSQWGSSGVCAQASLYMVALQLCLPERGYTRADGPFTISCIAADIAARFGGRPQSSDAAEAIARHLRYCVEKTKWRKSKRVQAFKIEGLKLNTMKRTLTAALGDPWRSPHTGEEMPKMTPVDHVLKPSQLSWDHLRFTIESYTSSGIPLLVQVDPRLSAAAVIATRHLETHRPYTRGDEDRVDQAHELLECALLGQKPPFSRKDGYHPLKDVHCVVVIGAKGLMGNETEAKVIYHCALHGPYRIARFLPFYLSATLPFMKWVGPHGPYLANVEGEPQIGWIAAVPDYIYFDPLSLFIAVRSFLDSTADDATHARLGDYTPAVTDESIWRVRMMHETKIWESYFNNRKLLDPQPMFGDAKHWNRDLIRELLPKREHLRGASESVLCFEVFRSQEDAMALRPKTVYFGYVSSDRQPPPGYKTPFTGGFGVERSPAGARVAFFHVTREGKFCLEGDDPGKPVIGSSLMLDDVTARPVDPA